MAVSKPGQAQRSPMLPDGEFLLNMPDKQLIAISATEHK
jgi:hypothetical protein